MKKNFSRILFKMVFIHEKAFNDVVYKCQPFCLILKIVSFIKTHSPAPSLHQCDQAPQEVYRKSSFSTPHR